MQMQINGKGKFHEVAGYDAASAKFRAEQERIGYRGPSDRTVYPRQGVLFVDGEVVAHVSQNGRVWAGSEWATTSELLYSPN